MEKYLQRNSSSARHRTEERDRISTQITYANIHIFGNKIFRNKQEDIIKTILENKDVFIILPTGGGKSLCYQLPAILSKGVTIVISPLLSLVEDQVSSLIQLPCGGIPAAYISSTSTELMIRAVFNDLDRARSGLEPYLKLVYVTPERIVKSLATREILAVLYDNEMLARFIVDEAHCVSSWGHDFRKDYGQLSLLKKEYPEVPIVALTATARRQVSEDTIKTLGIPNCKRFIGGFDRPNLKFEVCQKPSNLADSYRFILQIIRSFPPSSSGILYCMTKNETEKLSDFLRDNDISADYYHAGMTTNTKQAVQAAWLEGKIHVVCATIAYGMGIDKPDVRYVIHASLAKSLEGYYQEAGRAGRDGLRSECILLYRPSDVNSLQRVMLAPPKRKLSKVDEDRLEEMVNYCTNLTQCRRQTFYETFGTTESSNSTNSSSWIQKSTSNSKFQRCGTMCDNCLARSQEGSQKSGSEQPRHCYLPETRNTVIPDGQWTEKHSQSRKAKGKMASFTTASGKKIQPSIISLADEEEERDERPRKDNKKRKYDVASDEDDDEDESLEGKRRSSNSQHIISLKLAGNTTPSRGQKLSQSAKEVLTATTRVLISNQTLRSSSGISGQVPSDCRQYSGSWGGGRHEETRTRSTREEEVEVIE